jgi:hypothetical protein
MEWSKEVKASANGWFLIRNEGPIMTISPWTLASSADGSLNPHNWQGSTSPAPHELESWIVNVAGPIVAKKLLDQLL